MEKENAKAKKAPISNDITTRTIERAHEALDDILSDVIMHPEFDVDMFISNIVYWYEFQQLAKAYGKKLLYFKPREKKEGK